MIDTRKVLKDDAAATDCHMTNLGISHLPLRQADIRTGCAKQAVWPSGNHAIPIRRFASGDGIINGGFAISPAVKNAEHYWSGG